MLDHKVIDGTKLVGWLRGQQSITPLSYAEKVLYEKIIHHVVNMMEEEGVKNGER